LLGSVAWAFPWASISKFQMPCAEATSASDTTFAIQLCSDHAPSKQPLYFCLDRLDHVVFAISNTFFFVYPWILPPIGSGGAVVFVGQSEPELEG
jgi:hypothetical protein